VRQFNIPQLYMHAEPPEEIIYPVEQNLHRVFVLHVAQLLIVQTGTHL
jgi:hypothetical protein